MDPISHETFKRVVGDCIIQHYKHAPALIRWPSLKEHYSDYICPKLIHRSIDDWLENTEDPLDSTYNDTTLYQLAFDIFHGITQNANGEEYDIEDEMAKHILAKLKVAARNDKLRNMGIDDDQHDILDI